MSAVLTRPPTGRWLQESRQSALFPRSARFACWFESLAVASRPLQDLNRPGGSREPALLLFPEQNEAAAMIDQCVVFEVDSGAGVYCI